MKRKGIIISIIGIIIVALSLLGITFGYYYTRILGNENATSVKVTAAMKAVKYIELSEEVSGTLIKPGYEYIKTFAVTSLSNEEAIYHIYLDDVINEFTRTQDITYTLYRKSGNNTIDTSDLSDCEEISSGIFPKTNNYIKLNEKLLTKGDSYTYALKINYLKSTEEQDIDDGKTFGFKVQIHSEFQNPYSSDTTLLAYNIINNAIGLTEQEKEAGYAELRTIPLTTPAVETTMKYNTTGEEATSETSISVSTTYQGYFWTYGTGYKVDPITGKFTLTGVSTCQYNDGSCNETLVGKYIANSSASSNSSSTDTAITTTNLWSIYKVTVAPASSTSTITMKAKEINATYYSVESTLSMTPDEYGISYYYRGGVKNNYLSFNNMCWRIVRIEGDGAIKITLAAQKTCSTITNEDTGTAYIGTVNYGYTQGKVTNSSGQQSTDYKYVVDYVNGQTKNTNSMKYKLDEWLTSSGIDTSKLKEDSWCLGNTTDPYNDGGTLLTSTLNDLMYNGTSFYYDKNIRLYGKGQTANATLRCDGKNYKAHKSYIGALTADEVVYAGGKADTSNINYYLTSNATIDYWWTLSPSYFSGSADCIFSVRSDGGVFSNSVHYVFSNLRPAVSLISGTQFNGGDGSITNPYTIK